MVYPFPTDATKGNITSTVTESLDIHPKPSVVVTRYLVVSIGLAIGFEIVELLSQIAGDQTYVLPPDALS